MKWMCMHEDGEGGGGYHWINIPIHPMHLAYMTRRGQNGCARVKMGRGEGISPTWWCHQHGGRGERGG